MSRYDAVASAAVPTWLFFPLCPGDVAALADVYLNRQPFPFKAHFAALRNMSAVSLSAAPSQGPSPPTAAIVPSVRVLPPPGAIFVASDSTEVGPEIAAEARRAPGAWAAALGLSAPLEGPPTLISVNQSARFLALHGSHTVSSEGACTPDGVCGLPWEQLLVYRTELAKKGAWAWGIPLAGA